jgi:hypothetical protein
VKRLTASLAVHGRVWARRGNVGAALVAALASVVMPTTAGAAPAEAGSAGDWIANEFRCDGIQVDRCTWLELSVSAPLRIRAGARITDDRGWASDYLVAVHDVRVQWRRADGRWVLFRGTWGYDYDGWWEVRDRARSRARRPACGGRDYRAVAHHHWLGASPGARRVVSGTIGIHRQC